MKRAWTIALAIVTTPISAGAESGKDATYGRIDGDVAVVGALGMTLGPRAPRATADARLRYLSTAGMFFTYEDGPLIGASAEPRRVMAVGAELRPLFLARWARGLEWGSPRLDLAFDSIGLELGAVFLQPEGASFGGRPGLQAGLGFELPFMTTATGLFLSVHAGARWSNAALGGGPLAGPGDRAAFLTLAFSWQQIFGAHVVDLGDPAP
jgi:hypothetical protein